MRGNRAELPRRRAGTAPGRHRRQAVAREYRRLAPRYDERWGIYIERTVAETMRRLPLGPDVHLLDVACGTGALLQAVSAAEPGARLAGIDLSPEMLAVASSRLAGRAGLAVASVEALPFRDAAFDLVVSTNAFHFFPDPRRALTEMRRVLRAGGSLVVTDWCDDYLSCRLVDGLLRLLDPAHYHVYGSAECAALLESAGFRRVDVERYRITWLWGLMTAVARKPA